MRKFVGRCWRILPVLGFCLVAACGNDTPPGPDPVTEALSGTWAGEVEESYGGRGTLTLVIEQVQFALSGTFVLEFQDSARNRAGTLSGNTDLPPLPKRIQLASSTGFDCAPGQSPESFVQLNWTRTGDTLKGTYLGFGCTGTVTGSFELTRVD